MNENSTSWCIKSSNEDLANIPDWTPNAQEVKRLFNLIKNNEEIKLDWQSPGYRSMDPEADQIVEEEQPATPSQIDDILDDFDFQDEGTSSLCLPKRRDGDTELKGSAKKRTTNLDDVLSNIRRHRKLQRDLDQDLAVPVDNMKMN